MGHSTRCQHVSRGHAKSSANDARFASAILLRPFQVNKRKKQKQAEKPMSEYEQQVELKRRMKTMLENEQLIPRVGSQFMFAQAVHPR